ncbi:MAG: MarR family transcriptional regulator [bacterium]
MDHIGVALWHAAQGWKADFNRQMVERGHAVFAEAASNALAHIGPSGITQNTLAQRLGVSKQATQQMLDRLQSLDLILRQPDARDSRAKRVFLSPSAKRVMTEANQVKLAIEASYRATLGDAAFATLKSALTRLEPQS